MALAALTGRCWVQLCAGLPGFRPVPDERVALIGARDLDPLERRALEGSRLRRLDGGTLRQQLPPALESVWGGALSAYLHLDLDVLDPAEGRANTYAAAGGLSRADAEWAVGAVGAAMPIEAAALTAFDPRADATGRARDAALTLATAVVNAAASGRRSVRTV
jgi:arginase